MIDWHSHILPGVDDGPTDIEQSVAIAAFLAAGGFTEVYCTPHLMRGGYGAGNDEVRRGVARLQERLTAGGIPITLRSGREYCMDEYLQAALDDPLPLGDSRLVLVECRSMSSATCFRTGEIASGRLGPILTIFCMVGVMNALNLADGLDGLAGGLSAIAAIFLGLFAYLAHNWVPLWILLALVGSLFGFLRYNTHPAKLFMGDTGSLLLGYTLSAAAVMLVQNDQVGIHLASVTVATVLALPITDTLLVMGRRLRHGQNPFWPDRTHLHHRLMDLGLRHAAVVRVLYLCAGAFGVQV